MMLPAMMMPLLLFLTPLWPLLVLVWLVLRSRGPQPASPFTWLWLSAPLPALLLAILATGDPAQAHLRLDGFLLGSLWWVDEIRRVFLLLTSLLWLLAGSYARGYLAQTRAGLRFAIFWLLTLSGNLLLVIAEDVASFYMGFTLMSLAAYGLVVHEQTPAALGAGRSYLYLALLGEGLLLAGLLGAASQTREPQMAQLAFILAGDKAAAQPLAMCLLLGLGIKAGLPFLHVWLPLAHSVAPTPASAVLSGAMVKAGLLGWWLTLPLGLVSWPNLGLGVLVLGLIGALGAALLGSLQSQVKAVLAYSSISQLGMMTSLVGASLMQASLWPQLLPVLLLFAAHHALVKGSLFLAVGVSEQRPRQQFEWLFRLLLLLPPMALIGWLSSGTLSKTLIKSTLYEHGWTLLAFCLTLAALGTALLMLAYLRLLYQKRQEQKHQEQKCQPPADKTIATGLAWMQASWLLLLVCGLLLPLWLPLPEKSLIWPDLAGVYTLAWPPGVALLLMLLAGQLGRRFPGWKNYRPPSGDLLWVYKAGIGSLQKAVSQVLAERTRLGWRLSELLLAKPIKSAPVWLNALSIEAWARRDWALLFVLLLFIFTGFLFL